MAGAVTNIGGSLLQNAATNSPILKAMQAAGGMQPPTAPGPAAPQPGYVDPAVTTDARPAQPSASPLPAPVDVGAAPKVAEKGRNLLWRQAIADIESGGGNYKAVGPKTKTGDRALGKYQIMGANVPQWTREVLGRSMTPNEFLANEAAQDAVFDAKFGQYVNQYGERGAAQAWLGGPGSVGKGHREDQLGTSVDEYSNRFMASLGQPGSGGANSGQPVMSPLQRILAAGAGGPQSPDVGAGTPSETAATQEQPSALERILGAGRGGMSMQMAQAELPQPQQVQAPGANMIASSTQSAVENVRSPSQKAAARKEALRARMRGSANV